MSRLMTIGRLKCVVAAAFAAVVGASFGAVKFENQFVRWQIGDDAKVSTMVEKSTGRELVGEKTAFVAIVGDDGVLREATSCTGDAKKLSFAFADGSAMSLKVSTFPGGWTFETADCRLKDAASVWFVRLRPACAEYFGRFANAISDDKSAVFVRGYEAKTEMYCADDKPRPWGGGEKANGILNGKRILCAGAVKQFGFDGHRAGLAAAPRGKILGVMKEMTKASGAPWSVAGGAWAQGSEACRGSYLFTTSMDEPSVDDWIALAERGGFDLVHFHVWWKLYGSYEIDTDCFPGGYAALKAAAKKVRDAGFRVGTHTLSACIEWGSKCLTPVCDTNLISTYTYTLAKPFAPGDTEMVVNEPFWDKQAVVFSGRMGALKGNGNTFRIGRELVQYWGADRDARKFTGIKRGVFECQRGKYPVTIGGTYPAGTKIHYLRNCYSAFYPEPDSPLMDETIAKIDAVFNECDMEEIYFDGSEGMGSRYAIDRMRERIFRSLKPAKDGIINEASCRNPYHWWFRSRLWPWDHNWYGPKALQDLHVSTTMRQVVKEDFLSANTGWWAPLTAAETQRGHFLDEMEYFMCKNVAHDVSMAIQGTYVTDGPLSFNMQRQMTLLGWWERMRMARAFRSGLQDEMKPEGREFRLRQSDCGDWTVTPVKCSVHRSASEHEREWAVSADAPSRGEIRVEALYGVGPEAKGAEPVLTANDKLEIATAEGVTAKAGTGSDAEHGKTVVLSATNSGKESYGAWALAAAHHPYPNLLKTVGAFGCWVKGDGSGATLAFRLMLHRYNWGGICEHYLKLDFKGWRYVTFLLRERDAEAYSKMKWDISGDWEASRRVYNGPWWATDPSVEWVKVGLNEIPAGGSATVEIGEVRQFDVVKRPLSGAEVVVNGQALKLPFDMAAGDYAELADGEWTLFDELGNPKRRAKCGEIVSLEKGENKISFRASDASARAEVTVFGLGEAKYALGNIAAEKRRWMDYEAVMPAVYAPSKGFDAPVKAAVRPGERARLSLEIWGPVDTPSVKLGGRTWTFPVKLEKGDHVVCRDGVEWKAERVKPGKTAEDAGVWFKIAPSAREPIDSGRLDHPLPTLTGGFELKLGAKDPKTCMARFEFVKRYLKPYRLWTLDEIKAGVTEKGDEVAITYPKDGFRLASMTEGGVDTSHLGKIGKGRTEFSKIYVVPAEIYDSAKVLVSVDPDRKRDRTFTVRITRYNDGTTFGGRDFAGMMNVAVDFDKAEKRSVGKDLWEVTVPLDMGGIADLVWGGDMYGTWLNNSLRPSESRVNKKIGNYLDFEILPRLVKNRSPMQDARMCPDARFKNGVTVHGATLHKAGLAFEVVQSQVGNVFAADEKPETSLKLATLAPGKWTLRRVVRDVEGNVLADATESFSGEKTFTFDLSQKSVGWYALDYTVAKDGRAVLTHKASFALLPPDTRREGIGAGPYGSWSYGGNHYNFGKVDEYGPLFLKAGLRRNVGVNGGQGHKYKMSPPAVSWDRYRKMTEEERVADIRRQREDNPNVTTFLMFHEDAPWSYQHAWELTGQKVPDPEKYGVAGWKVGSGNMKGGMDKRAERHRRAMEQCKFMREHFPEVKITMGNSLACTEIIAEQLRQGLPKEYVDYMGIESVVRNMLPEREGDMCFQVADMMMQLAKFYGCDKWRPNATWEAGYRTDALIGLEKQAAWQVRDVLLEQAWRFPDIFIGIITDCGNVYGGSFWGGSGLCYRTPTAYPKPVYVGVATVTRLLDQVVASRRIPCGDECVYVNEYTRRDGKCVTALWTSRGNAEVALALASADVEYVDFYGRPTEPLRNEGGLWSNLVTKSDPIVEAGEFVKYIVSDGPAVRSAKVGRRTFPGWDKAPDDAELVTKTDSASEWRLETEKNTAIEITKGPFLPYRTLGKYEVREVVDEERGKCLELELVEPNTSLPLIMNEYAVLELRKPIPLDGDPATVGAWVKGNSGWGQFYWVLEDAKGKRYYSCGQGADADVFDYDGTVSLCYTGWNYLKMPINDKSTVRNLSTGGAGIIWRGGSFSGKMKLAGIAFAAMNRPLFLTERRPHRQVVRVGGVYASDFAK